MADDVTAELIIIVQLFL